MSQSLGGDAGTAMGLARSAEALMSAGVSGVAVRVLSHGKGALLCLVGAIGLANQLAWWPWRGWAQPLELRGRDGH